MANIQKRANWTQLSGAERAPSEALPPPPKPPPRTCALGRARNVDEQKVRLALLSCNDGSSHSHSLSTSRMIKDGQGNVLPHGTGRVGPHKHAWVFTCAHVRVRLTLICNKQHHFNSLFIKRNAICTWTRYAILNEQAAFSPHTNAHTHTHTTSSSCVGGCFTEKLQCVV